MGTTTIAVGAMLSLSLVVGCSGQRLGMVGAGGAVLEPDDPLGVELASVGLVAGERPCGDDEHVASVVDARGRYVAFCRDERGRISTLQTARVGEALVLLGRRSPLEDYLDITPQTAEVPAGLLTDRSADVRGRRVVERGVAHRAQRALPADLEGLGPVVIGGPTVCSDPESFEDPYCSSLVSMVSVADAYYWTTRCDVGPATVLLRTASSQLDSPQAAGVTGRMVVAACGTAPTRLVRYGKGGVTERWIALSHTTVQSGYVIERTVDTGDVVEGSPILSGSPYFASDVRFRVDARPGGWFRSASAFAQRHGPIG
jgi:hypothetical protein